jgi:hypothetical protein
MSDTGIRKEVVQSATVKRIIKILDDRRRLHSSTYH